MQKTNVILLLLSILSFSIHAQTRMSLLPNNVVPKSIVSFNGKMYFAAQDTKPLGIQKLYKADLVTVSGTSQVNGISVIGNLAVTEKAKSQFLPRIFIMSQKT